MKSTNYFNTFIEIAEDCPVASGEVPPEKSTKTVANMQFEMILNNPYKYTSDDVIFRVYAERNGIPASDLSLEREKFFSRGQACLRSSPLTKRYGWGVHSNEEGRIAIYPVGSKEYKKFVEDEKFEHVKAMRSKRA